MIIGVMNIIRHKCVVAFGGVAVALCVSCQYNQRQSESSVAYEPNAIELGGLQTPDTWNTHNLYSAFTISVPNTMEMSGTNGQYNQWLNSVGLQRNANVVMFQQKSLNKRPMVNADEHYCRVFVNYERANSGDLLHSYETEVIDADTRAWLLENVENNLAYSQQLLSEPSYQWVDIDGTKAIRVKYSRGGNNGNTTA